jgi:hypothetical protein
VEASARLSRKGRPTPLGYRALEGIDRLLRERSYQTRARRDVLNGVFPRRNSCAEKVLGLLPLGDGGFHEWIATPGKVLAVELSEARFACFDHLRLHQRCLILWLLHDKNVR